jgi:hypothetical protein
MNLDIILARASEIAGAPISVADDHPAVTAQGLCFRGSRSGLTALCAHFGFRYSPSRKGREGVYLTGAKVAKLATFE